MSDYLILNSKPFSDYGNTWFHANKKEFAEITSSTGPEYKPRLRLQAQLGSGPTVPTEAGDSMPHKTKCAHKRQLFLKHFHMRSAAAQDHSVQHFCVELYTKSVVQSIGLRWKGWTTDDCHFSPTSKGAARQ